MGAISYRFFFSDQKPTALNLIYPQPSPTPLPLLKYTIGNLKNYDYQASDIIVEDLISENEKYSAYLFSYTSQGKKITGQLNLPNGQIKGVIVMIRGYVPAEIYTTGVGTRSAAGVLASNGYLTLAPDFLGFGGSDSEPEDSWEARFIKPINVIELIKSIQNSQLNDPDQILQSKNSDTSFLNIKLKNLQLTDKVGIWSHSNGGQIALTVLEILSQPIPTTLWAPVSAPFPYSVMFYSDEVGDEGKAMRKWVSIFEDDYDVFDFSLTQHLDLLTGPLLLHHGTIDDAAPVAWSDEFQDKIDLENDRRQDLIDQLEVATDSGIIEQIEQQILDPIDLTYYSYSGADHNMSPVWDTVIARDIEFFDKYLLN